MTAKKRRLPQGEAAPTSSAKTTSYIILPGVEIPPTSSQLTEPEAARLTRDLDKSIAALQGLNRLIKEVATKPGDVQ